MGRGISYPGIKNLYMNIMVYTGTTILGPPQKKNNPKKQNQPQTNKKPTLHPKPNDYSNMKAVWQGLSKVSSTGSTIFRDRIKLESFYFQIWAQIFIWFHIPWYIKCCLFHLFYIYYQGMQVVLFNYMFCLTTVWVGLSSFGSVLLRNFMFPVSLFVVCPSSFVTVGRFLKKIFDVLTNLDERCTRVCCKSLW